MKKNIFKLNILLYSLLSLVIFTACEDDEDDEQGFSFIGLSIKDIRKIINSFILEVH